MADDNKTTETNTLSGGAFRPNALGAQCPAGKPDRAPQMVAIPAFPPYLSSAKPK